jgi:hypothetical protein
MMLLLNRPIGTMEFVTLTGWRKQSVSQGLDTLELHGYAAQIGRYHGWILTDKSRQMVLPGFEAVLATAIEGGKTALDSATAIGVEGQDPATAIRVEGRKTALEARKTALASSTSVDVGTGGRASTDGSVVVVDLYTDLSPDQQQQQEDARVEKQPSREIEVLEACAEHGITGIKATRLAMLDWITADRVREAVQIAERQGWDNPQGMAITRLEARTTTGSPPARRKPKSRNDRSDVGYKWQEFIDSANRRPYEDAEEADHVDS